MAMARHRQVALLGLLVMLAVAGCAQQPANHPKTPLAPTPSAVRQAHVAAVPARAAAPARLHRHRSAPHTAPVQHPAVKPPSPADAASAEAQLTCVSTKGGLDKVIGGHLSPADNAAAPALLTRLERLGRDGAGGLDPKSQALAAAVAGATTLTRQWSGVLVIGPEDKLHAEQVGRKVLSAIAEVDAAAKSAGLGDCAIPL